MQKPIAVTMALCLTACSFVGVRTPVVTPGPTPDAPKTISCSESSLLPALDAAGGAIAMSAAAVGVFREQFKDAESPAHFTAYYAGPLVAIAIAYWYSAAFGTSRAARCTQLKEDDAQIREVVRPIE